MRVIISGGGTGGHIYPAIAIANAIKEMNADAEILFVGADGKMEMSKVPEAGYEILGLPVRGLQRKLSFSTFVTVYRLIKSLIKSRKIIKSYKPDIAIGVGGYASGPLCYIASKFSIPVLLQEQNSYPGITNKILASKACKICVAYEGMDRFFDKSKIILTGNPVRQDIMNLSSLREEAYKFYGLDVKKKTIIILGGSLGARTLNESVMNSLDIIKQEKDIQIVWQTGSFYEKEMSERMKGREIAHLHKHTFLGRMDYIYSLADLIISRAGACTISELCLCAKATILVPSPNVAEDHQTMNALALSTKDAAILIKDNDAVEILIKNAVSLVKEDAKLDDLSNNIHKLALKDSAEIIAGIAKDVCKK
jgi:UDP-N-acetylglucosamine--N-acetylmuramyl-(pentapeptide) pyrophosphoryl-undecaprenol N-acetylglucosamine transferase